MKYVGTYSDPKDIVTKDKLEAVTNDVQTQLNGKQSTISATGILKGTGDGNVEAAVPGTDYLAESDLFICTVTASGTSYTCDKTPQQVISAVSAGKIAVAKLNAAIYFLTAGNTQAVYFTRTDNTTVYTLLVMGTGTARLNTTSIQAANLITDLKANKTSDTTYPSSKAVWDTTPHPDTKTDEQTQPVSMDGDGKLWTAPSTDPDVFTGADATTAGAVGMVPAPTAGQQSKFLKGDGSWSDLPNASTGARGVTYLVDSYTRTDTDKAVTPKALNNVYKLIPVKVSQLENDSGYITIAAVPTKTSELENDSGFITFAPVTSVNGETGNVVLEASDVGAATTGNIQSYINRTSAVDEPNTSYTSYMARGEALYGYEATPSANGCIAWQYE